jgi:hypothetical protein
MSSVRKISPYSTDQGNEGTCWAHSRSRLISRLIKSFGLEPGDDYPDEFYDTIMFEEGEILEEYYDTINCSSEHTIFHCIAHAQDIHERKGKPFSMHKSLNKMINWESENLSALLFHFILNCLTNKYGCIQLWGSGTNPIFYFLKLIHQHITEEQIKAILKYSRYEPEFIIEYETDKDGDFTISSLTFIEELDYAEQVQIQENTVMFLRLITKLASIFELLRIALVKKTLKINLFMLDNLYDGKLSGDFFKINDKGNAHRQRGILRTVLWPIRGMWFKRIKQVLEQGLYVLLCIYEHAILITGIEEKFFIVKNSWGSKRDWILPDGLHFIVDNKLSIYTLIKQSKTTYIELVYIEFETPRDEIFTKKKLSNKSIIHTLKKTAKRLSACFGMGKKNKTQKKFKKYHKK